MDRFIKYLKSLFRTVFRFDDGNTKLENQPCYDEQGRFLGWFSRSVAVATFVYCKNENGDWCVLASERGKGTADYQGYWNCPCGYLDFNETVKSAAARELREECGVDVNLNELEFVGYTDSPMDNRQNVCLMFRAVISDRRTSDFSFSKDGNEKDEVGLIKWVPIRETEHYLWAFNHDALIDKFFHSELSLK